MSLSILVDMNLTPDWVPFLAGHGHVAVHWSTVGAPNAVDLDLMIWARSHGYGVLTHDLDFGTILAVTHATGPSVLTVRIENPLPKIIGTAVVDVLARCEAELRAGALVVVDAARSRVRILPI